MTEGMGIGVLVYFSFIALVGLVALPVVLLADKIWGESKERNEGLCSALVFVCFGIFCWGVALWG